MKTQVNPQIGIFLLLVFGFELALSQQNKPLSPGGVDWCGNSWGSSHLQARLYNFTSTPLTLALSANKRFVQMIPNGTKCPVGYWLGVIRKKEGKPCLVKMMNSQPWDCKPGLIVLAGAEREVEAALSKAKPQDQVAVVQVSFADGTVWRALGENRTEPGKPNPRMHSD